MSRQSSGPVNPNETTSLPAIVDELFFQPTAGLRALKAKFLVRIQDNPLIEYETLSKDALKRLTQQKAAIDANWDKPGFKEWLFNRDENRERLEQLFTTALDAIERVLLSDDVKTASAKINALKVIGELANKFPKQGDKEKDPLSNMNRQELENFLEKSGVKIEKQLNLVIDTNTSKES